MADTNIIIGGDTRQLERDIQATLSKDFKLTGFNAKSFSQPLGKIKGQLGEFEKSLEASNARVVAFGASAGSVYLLTDAFKSMIQATISVEKNLADINTVLNVSEKDIKSFGNTIFDVANKTSQSFEIAADAALEFSRQGLGLEETAKRTADALTLARLSGLSAASSVEALTAAINSYGDASLNTTQIVNKLAAVDARYAVSSADLAEAIKRVGSSANEAGVNIDQLIALVTSAQQTTARGGAVIGNSFKTIFTRLQRPKVLEDLRELGIQTSNVTGETLPLIQILSQLARTFDNLGSAQKSQVAELVGGVYQINILKAVLGDLSKGYSTYSGALKASSGATNEAEQRINKLGQTVDSQVNRITNNLKRAGSIIGELTIAPALEKVLSGANAVLETFALGKEPQTFGEKAATGFLKGLGSFISGPGLLLGATAAFQIFRRLATFVGDAGKTILGLGQAAQQQAQIQAQILQLLQRNPELYAKIESGAVSVQSAAQGYLAIVNATNAALERQKNLASQIAGAVGPNAPIVMGNIGAVRPSKSSTTKTRAGGYIPSDVQAQEKMGARMGGYKPGKVVKAPSSVGGVMNSAEKVKYIPGFAQPFINPPKNSKAGVEHRKNAEKMTGINPYKANGFVPNFAKNSIEPAYIQEKYNNLTSRGVKPNKTQFAYSLNIDRLPSTHLNADQSLDFRDKKVDAKFSNSDATPIRNDAFDTISGQINVLKFLDKDILDNSVNSIWSKVLSGKNDYSPDDPQLKAVLNPKDTKSAFNRALKKNNISLADLREKYLRSIGKVGDPSKTYKTIRTNKPLKSPQDFASSIEGDKNNFIGTFYEQTLLKNLKNNGYKLAKGEYSAVDLVAKKGSNLPPIEAKGGQAELDQLIRKGIRSSSLIADDVSENVNFGQLTVVQPYGSGLRYSSGFIPNFSPLIDDNARNKHDFPGGIPILPIPDKALQNIVDRQKKRQMTYLDFDRTLVRTMGDIAYSRVSKDQKKGVLQKMFLNKEARLNDIKNSKLTQFGELLRKKIQEGVVNPSLLGLLTASDETPGMPEYISNVWRIPKANQVYSAKPGTKEAKLASLGVSASGFIPNFENLDVGARSMLIDSGFTPFVIDLKRKTIAASSAADDMFHSQIVNKKFLDPKTKKPIYPELHGDDIHSAAWQDTFVRGFVDTSSGKVDFHLTAPQKEDKNFTQKYSTLLEQVRNKYAKKFEEAKTIAKSTPQIRSKKLSPLQQVRKQLGSGPYPVNHFNNGFIPNFNFIKGRNTFQKTWLVETAKKRNLDINNPDTFKKLATEFAKTYPNNQGMFALSKGFIPNFAAGDGSISLEEYMTMKYGEQKPLTSLGGAALNAAYGKGVSLEEIKKKVGAVNPKYLTWTPGGAATALKETQKENRIQAQKEFTRKYGYRKIILPWEKTLADFGGDAKKFGQAYEDLVNKKFGGKRPNRFKSANEYGVYGANPITPMFNTTAVDFINPKSATNLSLGGTLIEARGGDKKNYNPSDITKKFEDFFNQNPSYDPKKWKRVLVSRNAAGFIPNFNAVEEAMGREMSAGYSSSQVKVGKDNKLKTSFNPMGLGVYNSTEGSLGKGISLAEKAGINPKTKGMASGFVPNFAFSFGLSEEEYYKSNPLGSADLEAKKNIKEKEKAREEARKRFRERTAAGRKARLDKKLEGQKRKLEGVRSKTVSRGAYPGEAASASAKASELQAKIAEQEAKFRAGESARAAREASLNAGKKTVAQYKTEKALGPRSTQTGFTATIGGKSYTSAPVGKLSSEAIQASIERNRRKSDAKTIAKQKAEGRAGIKTILNAKPPVIKAPPVISSSGGGGGGKIPPSTPPSMPPNNPPTPPNRSPRLTAEQRLQRAKGAGKTLLSGGSKKFDSGKAFMASMALSQGLGMAQSFGLINPESQIGQSATKGIEMLGLGMTAKGLYSEYGAGIGKKIASSGVGQRIAGSALGRGVAGVAGRLGASFGGMGALGPLAAAYGVGKIGQMGFDYFGGDRIASALSIVGGPMGGLMGDFVKKQGGGFGKMDIEAEKQKAIKELEKFKTESGKSLSLYSSAMSSKYGGLGEATGEKVKYGIPGFRVEEELQKYDIGGQRREAIQGMVEGLGGIENASRLLKESGGIGMGKGSADQFAKNIISTLQKTKKETGGLDIISNKGYGGTNAEGYIVDKKNAMIQAKDLAAGLIKEITKFEKIKSVNEILNKTNEQMSTLAARATMMLTVYRELEQKERERGQVLRKNFAGGAEGYFDPNKSADSMLNINRALKTLNDPRLARNQMERGRAAQQYLTSATEMGIDIAPKVREQLSKIMDAGLKQYQAQNLNTLMRIGGGYKNNFGLQQGMLRGFVGTGAAAERSGLSIQEDQLSQNQQAVQAGYLNKLDVNAMPMLGNSKALKTFQDTAKRINQAQSDLNRLAQGVATGSVSMQEFQKVSGTVQAASQLSEKSPQYAQERSLAAIEQAFKELSQQSQVIAKFGEAFTAANNINLNGNVNIGLTKEAVGYLRVAEAVYNANHKPKEKEGVPPNVVQLGQLYNNMGGMPKSG